MASLFISSSFSHSVLSLRLGFGFGLIFCYRYQCICKFMVVAMKGCCGGDGNGFTVDLRRWPQILVAIGHSLG